MEATRVHWLCLLMLEDEIDVMQALKSWAVQGVYQALHVQSRDKDQSRETLKSNLLSTAPSQGAPDVK